MAAGSYTNGGDNDKHQLDSIETGTAKAISEIAKEHLSDDGAKEGEEVDEETRPFASMRPVHKGYRSKNNIGREEVVSVKEKCLV